MGRAVHFHPFGADTDRFLTETGPTSRIAFNHLSSLFPDKNILKDYAKDG
jgi:hypothetical protein